MSNIVHCIFYYSLVAFITLRDTAAAAAAARTDRVRRPPSSRTAPSGAPAHRSHVDRRCINAWARPPRRRGDAEPAMHGAVGAAVRRRRGGRAARRGGRAVGAVSATRSREPRRASQWWAAVRRVKLADKDQKAGRGLGKARLVFTQQLSRESSSRRCSPGKQGD